MEFVLRLFIVNWFWMFVLCVISNAVVQRECPGVVSPNDDIDLQVGADLVINCTLSQYCKYPNKNIFWMYQSVQSPMKTVDVKYTKNNSQLYIPSVNITDGGVYTCMVKTDNFAITIGNSVVTVQYYPLTNASFQCVSYNLEKIICTWSDANVPENETEWTVSNIVNKRLRSCNPIGSLSEHTCEISGADYPINSPTLHFRVKVTKNKLGANKTRFEVIQYKNVIVGPPRFDEERTLISDRSAILTWLRPLRDGRDWYTSILNGLDTYFEYKIQYTSRWGSGFDITRNDSYTLKNLVPNTFYTLCLCVRLVHKNYTNKWSDFDNMTLTTNPTIPDSWNAMATGSFSQYFFNQNRQELIIYWKPLPNQNQNGDAFRYQIATDGENRNEYNTTDTSITLEDLQSNRSYSITVKGINAIGESKNASRIFVTGQTTTRELVPASPIIKDVVNFNNGSYYVEWINIDSSSTVDVFWCEVVEKKTDLPRHCVNGINWYEISSGQSNVTFVLDKTKQYRFAVASYANDTSRGLVWNSCEIPKSRTPIPVIRNIKFSQSVDYINITWSLSCEERFQDITGFRISYNDEESFFVRQVDACTSLNNNDKCSYMLTNLSAETTYSIGLSVVTNKGNGTRVDETVSTKVDVIIATSDNNNIEIIIGALTAVTLVIVAVVYAYKKCVSDRLRVLKNLRLPPGIIEKCDVIDCDISRRSSLSVYVIKDEFEKFQSTSAPESFYNSSAFASKYTSSLDSGLEEEALLKTNMRTFSQSSDDSTANDQQPDTDVPEIDLFEEISLKNIEHDVKKTGKDVDSKFQSGGYTTAFTTLNEDSINQNKKSYLPNTELLELSDNTEPSTQKSDLTFAGKEEILQSSGYVRISCPLNEHQTEDTIKEDVPNKSTVTMLPCVLGDGCETPQKREVLKQSLLQSVDNSECDLPNAQVNAVEKSVQSSGYVTVAFPLNG